MRAYLASIAYADAMVGRVLDALEESPHRDNTIVVLWSDHGWHLGEKEHWRKFTGWRVCARVPLIVRVPQGAYGLPAGTTGGTRCHKPVNLVDLYRTLNELYDVANDPYEWRNLAGDSKHAEDLSRLRRLAPRPSVEARAAFETWQEERRRRQEKQRENKKKRNASQQDNGLDVK